MKIKAPRGAFCFMKKIGLLSDTHSFLDPKVFQYFAGVDEIWHAGDIGDVALAERLLAFKPLRAVFGNIDGKELRQLFPEDLHFEIEGKKVFMTHIGGYPGKYQPRVKKIIEETRPDLFICGHSHILKIIPDKIHNLLHINPGACGNYGWHKVKTLVRFELEAAKIQNLEVIEIGTRG